MCVSLIFYSISQYAHARQQEQKISSYHYLLITMSSTKAKPIPTTGRVLRSASSGVFPSGSGAIASASSSTRIIASGVRGRGRGRPAGSSSRPLPLAIVAEELLKISDPSPSAQAAIAKATVPKNTPQKVIIKPEPVPSKAPTFQPTQLIDLSSDSDDEPVTDRNFNNVLPAPLVPVVYI